MDGTVTGDAFGGVVVAVLRDLAVNAGGEFLHFLGVTLRTLSGNQVFRRGQVVHAAMTRSARGFAEDGVGAGGESFGLVRMAGGALHSGYFGGMRELFDGGVAILAAENSVGAGGMLGRVDGNAFSGGGLHSRFAMAGQTFLVCGGRSRGGSHNQSQVN